MFSSIMKYFANDSVSEGNNGEDSTTLQDEQQQESPESELEKLKRQNEKIKEQLEQKLVLTDAGHENINFDIAELGSVASVQKNSHKEAVAQLLGPTGKGPNRDGQVSSRKIPSSQKKGDKDAQTNNNQEECRLINADKQQGVSNNKLQFQQLQSMKKSKSTNKAKDKLDSSKHKSKNTEPNESQKSSVSSNLMQGMSLELDKIQLSSTDTQSLASMSSTKVPMGKNKDGSSNRAQNPKDGQKHESGDKVSDPITGVLKHKINKNSKKTKEVSLTLNHSNIQQLVQLLQSHTGDSKKDMPDLLDGGEDPSHQQALNLIMQLITNNVHQSLSEDNDQKNVSKSSIPQGIDPQLLQQLFYIDKEEEECTDSDDYDECESDEDEDEIDDESDDDDDQDSDQEDMIEDCEDMDDMDEIETDNEDMKDDYGDEDDDALEQENTDEAKQQDGSSKDNSNKIKPSQRLQNQLNRQKLAKKKDANMLYNQSSSDEYLDHVDLISPNAEKSAKQSQNPQRVKEKLQKRKKQLEHQRAQLQNLQQQQKLQARMQKKRMKQQSDQQSDGQSAQTQFQPKEFQEDIKGQSVTQESIDDLKCQEEYIQQDTKSKTQQDTTTIDGDNSSQYEDLEYDSEQATSQRNQFNNGQKSDYNEASQQNLQKLLKQKLVISDKLSPQFHRFYEQFLNNIEYIIQYEYNILPEQKFYQNFGQPNATQSQNNSCYLADQRARDAAESILKKKYDNLRKLCEQNCKCFTGPHSVLQIFIEKIVQAVESFSSKLKGLARDDLQLWVEDSKFTYEDYQSDENEPNLNELNYSINGIDLNTIFKMQKLTQQQDSDFKQGLKDGLKAGVKQGPTSSVEHKLKQIEMNTKSEEAKQKLRELGKMTDNEISQLVQMADQYLKNKKNSKKFKPLLKNLPNYTNFLQSVIYHYNLIINNYAPAISRHFTEMTQVIKEGNQYEFPSQDIHRTIINKLIINDHYVFRHFFQHMKQEYLKHEKQIKKKIQLANANANNQQQTLLKENFQKPEASTNGMSKSTINLVKFVEVYEQFIKDVEQDINKGVSQLNIDYYMRDLRKHALEEYEEIFHIEEALLTTTKDEDNKTSPPCEEGEENLDYNEKLNQRYGFMLDAKEKKKLKKKQRKRDKKAKQQAQNADNQGQSDVEEANQENMQKDYDEVFQLSPEVYKKQYEFQDVINFDMDDIKNMSNKKKKVKGQSKLSQDEIKNLSTDELLSYIESEGKAKKQQMSLLEQTQKQVQSNDDNSTSPNDGQEENEPLNNSDQNSIAGESKQIQQMRAKAKAFIEKQQQQKPSAPSNSKQNEEKTIDPNSFTCKFCNGQINQKTGKFVHEKFCLVGTNGEKGEKPTSKKNQGAADKKADSSTQASKSTQSSHQKDSQAADQYDEDDQHIEEFARKLEQIQKQQPQYRINGSGGQRRRKKLKPNVSNDWVNKLRKTLKSQNQSVTPCNLADIQSGEIAESSDSLGSYNSSGNSNMAGAQSSSEAQLQKKRTKLSDLTQDHIKFNTQKLNLSVSASQNRKKMQAQASKKDS